MVPYVASAPPGYAAEPSAPPRPPHPWSPAAWAKGPIPLPLVVVFFMLSLALVGAIALGAIRLAMQDWAAAGAAAGVVALLLGSVYLVVTAVRVGLGRRTLSTILLGLAAVIVLGGLGGAGLLLPPALHQAQARSFETSGNWAAALREYQLAGERAPNSRALARVHDEWGEALERQGQYASAFGQFTMVIADYSGAQVEVARAQTDDARTHFEYGTQLASQGDTQGAISAFEYVSVRYASSPYASQAHAAAATAYLALGKSQIGGASCSDALATYRTLVANYGDTAEGKQAKTALAASVDVKGQLINYPTNPAPIMYLSRTARVSSPSDFYFSNDYSATIGAGGNFTFHNVKQGAYSIDAFLPDGNGGAYWVDPTTGKLLVNSVGPLCTYDVGQLNWNG